ncbi:uncharacterized protein LOC114353153 [Ostrinia furnacalis]|uniref:uncharacterized protein LOC114353153 n=1 Tax=Ostrinia furnacalis TaxID=93504 RepID=UPI00103DAB57|nr:uncharacterized protein LOC114353153 [Ostrinia furnacalis]
MMIVFPKPKRTSEDSFTASVSASVGRDSISDRTYSTSAFETDIETFSSTLTENTLSMISTPWTTESWTVGTLDSNALGSSAFSWPCSDETMSSFTDLPNTSTSYGAVSPPLNSSKTTVTILCGGGSCSDSVPIKPLTRQNSKMQSTPDTFSSWTVETFTSSGWVSDIDSQVVKAKYPWSPSTTLSGTDIYPSTLDSLTSRKGSRVTIATTATFGSRKGEKGHITPMTYIGLNNAPEHNHLLNWAIEVKRIPLSDLPNIIAAV